MVNYTHHAPISVTPRRQEGLRWAGLAIAVALGLSVRLPFVLATDFPLNDGGLFYTMVSDLQRSSYVLPGYTSYNSANIPFAYPPLAFYLAALLDDLSPLSLIEVFRFLPLALNVATIVVFYFVSREMLESDEAAALAASFFALLPRSYEWLIMGGGLTRSLGFFFALLTLYHAYPLYARKDGRHLLPAIVFAGCTVLSHLEMASFVAYSVLILFVAYGRSRQGLMDSALLALGTVAMASFWLATVVERHGLAPLMSASDQGWPLFTGVMSLLFLEITNEPYFPVLGCLALLGGLSCLTDRKLLPVIWLVPMFALDPRSAPTMATVPLGLLAGIGATRVLVPILDQSSGSARLARQYAELKLPLLNARQPAIRLAHLILAGIAIYAVNAGVVGERSLLSALPRQQRDAMLWVAANTPPDSTFLVVTGSTWAVDKVSEWFPVLANRVSVATVQGHEWTGLFRDRMMQHSWIQGCAQREVECVEDWTKLTGLTFTYLYVAKPEPGGDDPCYPLRNSLCADFRYRIVYDGPGATIFTRGRVTGQR